ncbi:MAG: dihydroorotate dehydrogenase [Atopobiaceae bacterium]|nr:dihydroorotate dehydrogenase [Atopobiaceae bacterium]
MVGSPNMAVNLGGIEMKNPLNTASGTFGAGAQFEGFFDPAILGAITCKGCSAEPWQGNPSPRLWELPSGLMNSIGLQNPGVRGLIEEYGDYLRGLEAQGCRVICQVVGHSIDEYVASLELFEELADFASGIEVNVSCPNIAQGGAAMGATAQGAAEVVRALRPRTTKPLIIKMAPTNVAEVARACEHEGADALSLINTIPGMAIDTATRKSRVSRPTAGVSGPCIHAIAVALVWEAHNATSLPLCGIGGVSSAQDAAEFILAGATAVSIGTAHLYDPTAAQRILPELEAWVVSQGVNDINDLIGAFECEI